MAGPAVQPSFETVQSIAALAKQAKEPPNLVPLCLTIPADLLTPSAVYLKVTAGASAEYSFLFESAGTFETVSRYSFIGVHPRKIIKTGAGHGPECDPLPLVQDELSKYRVANVPSLKLPKLTGGAAGYVSYDCVRYFEPRTERNLKDPLEIPESLFMMFDTTVTFDHLFSSIKLVTHVHLPGPSGDGEDSLLTAYKDASDSLHRLLAIITSSETPLPEQPPIEGLQDFSSNIGRAGYEAHVTTLKKHICKGDIIQAVPSQRFRRPTSLHPFNLYRTLRTLNPSPYLFYISCADFHLVGASPELLVKSEGAEPLPSSCSSSSTAETLATPLLRPRVTTHPIAGTVARGATPSADEALANTLRASLKDRAEHVMLVDLARNDINRVCDPLTVGVDRLMTVEKFSHVQHLTSAVSGLLRPDKTRWDALRAVFPAGTVSGAPKVRAMELVGELEGERRGAYAGTAGWWGYDTTLLTPEATASSPAPAAIKLQSEAAADGEMDTCIMIRTMMLKDNVAYLQAGGGIVFDSVEEDEWLETMNKLASSMRTVELAEARVAGGEVNARSVEEVIAMERRKGVEGAKVEIGAAG